MKKKYISILITNYNKESYIKNTIKKYLNQNFKKKRNFGF